MSKSRNWCFTQFNMNQDFTFPVNYMIVGKETCPTTGREHYQGFVHFASPRAIGGVKKLLPGANLRSADGTAEQNRAYCTKETTFLETGTLPKQGKRTDLDGLLQEVIENPSMTTRTIMETHLGTWARNYRAIELAKSLVEERRDWVTEVHYVWGPSGSGKTRIAMEAGAVPVTLTNNFISNYNGEDVVLFDDIDKWTFFKNRSLFLTLLDRYECRVNVKGGDRNWKPRVIYLTSNYPPEESLCFDGDITDPAVARRITSVVEQKNGTEVGAG